MREPRDTNTGETFPDSSVRTETDTLVAEGSRRRKRKSTLAYIGAAAVSVMATVGIVLESAAATEAAQAGHNTTTPLAWIAVITVGGYALAGGIAAIGNFIQNDPYYAVEPVPVPESQYPNAA